MLRFTRVWVSLWLLFSAPTWLVAQIKSASIGGLVTDSSGAPVPGAKVTVVEQTTRSSQSITTNNSGGFDVPYLAAGRYSVNVQKEGFNSFRAEDVILAEVQAYHLEVVLQVGQVSTTVQVTAE